jgi:Ni,Fe-hydrogenase III component G
MSWRAITEADVLRKISGDELEAVRAAALANAQADPLAGTITDITKMVRGYVAACSNNSLDATLTTIPEELMDAAIALLVPKLMARVAGLSIDKEDVRKTDSANALQLMRDVAACRFAIVQPEDVSDEEVASPSPRFPTTERVRRFDREDSQDGI